ncbi:MAG: hypothetical protein H7Z40_19395 [Phycisphaerae bacterium]|nr:hypothetical protein [Gemmatimonadaceae bacterium]
MITVILSFAVAVALATVLHGTARKFVRDRLRYVDSVQKGFVPFIAGGAALMVVLPFTALPIIGLGTALTVGLAVGSGVAAGVRDIRSGVAPLIKNY